MKRVPIGVAPLSSSLAPWLSRCHLEIKTRASAVASLFQEYLFELSLEHSYFVLNKLIKQEADELVRLTPVWDHGQMSLEYFMS